MSILVGTNKQLWEQVNHDVPMDTFLGYDEGQSGPSGVPNVWPGPQAGPVPGPPVIPMICIKPDVTPLLSGQLDAPLRTFFEGAPADAMVCGWQEGNDNSQVPPLQFAAMGTYLRNLAAEVNPSLKIGQKFGGFAVWAQGQDLRPYVAPGMAWYGFDSYQHEKAQTPATQFGKLADAVREVWPEAVLAMTETNSTVNAGTWLQAAFEYAVQEKMILFQPYFGTGTNYDYPYGASIASALKGIKAEAAKA